MGNALVRKLENYARLSPENLEAASRLIATRPTQVRPRQDVIREGEQPRAVLIVVSGWACRHKFLEDGRRKTVILFLTGDTCDMNVFVLNEMDHFIGALTPPVIAQVPRDDFEAEMLAHPRRMQAMWSETLVNIATQREWTVNLGQRTAFERICRLLCEVMLRLRAVGLARGETCDFPLTQATIADITGLSAVHVSRTFQEIREAGPMEIVDRTLLVPDLEALMTAALFDPNYLHLGHEGRHLDADMASRSGAAATT